MYLDQFCWMVEYLKSLTHGESNQDCVYLDQFCWMVEYLKSLTRGESNKDLVCAASLPILAALCCNVAVIFPFNVLQQSKYLGLWRVSFTFDMDFSRFPFVQRKQNMVSANGGLHETEWC